MAVITKEKARATIDQECRVCLNAAPQCALLLLLLTLTCGVFTDDAFAADAAVVKEVVLELPPAPDNPRNSEGAFITLKDGRILFIYTHFTGGASDHAAACLMSRESANGGRAWTEKDALVVSNEGGMNVMSVSLLRLQSGAIALFYLLKNSEDDCRPLMRVSEDEAQTWSAPRACIEAPVGYYVVNNDRAIQTRSGRLILPAALHALQGEPFSQRGRVICWRSDDNGASWQPSAPPLEAPAEFSTGYQEPGVVELADGRLMMLLRNSSGVLHRSFSEDDGASWSPGEPTDLRSPLSPATCKRIPNSNALLLVWNDHGHEPDEAYSLRTPLALAVSQDNGKHWTNRRIIENDPKGWYCYTAMHFTDNAVLLAYCAGDTRVMNGLAQTRVCRIALTEL